IWIACARKLTITAEGHKRWFTASEIKECQLLAREYGILRRKLDWTARNRSVTRYFMEHTLAVADTMIALELSCRAQGIDLIPHQSASAEPLKWSVPVRHGGSQATIGIVPDRYSD